MLVSGKNMNSHANFYSNSGKNAHIDLWHQKHALYKHDVGGEGGVAIWSSCRSQSHTSEAGHCQTWPPERTTCANVFTSKSAMSERKISKAHRKDRESTVSAVDIKSLTSSESTFSLRPLKVGQNIQLLDRKWFYNYLLSLFMAL